MSHLTTSPLLVLSPHADDAVLSCGGLLLAHPDAEVVTVCSGDSPQPRPKRYRSLASPSCRRKEDRAAMDLLGCEHHELGESDAIDRRGSGGRLLYKDYGALFGGMAREDRGLLGITGTLQKLVSGRILLCPTGIGRHVDHQIASLVGLELASLGQEVWFYEDAPYVFPLAGRVPVGSPTQRWAELGVEPTICERIPMSLEAKANVIACYSSQVEALFGDLNSYMKLARGYLGGAAEQFHQFVLIPKS